VVVLSKAVGYSETGEGSGGCLIASYEDGAGNTHSVYKTIVRVLSIATNRMKQANRTIEPLWCEAAT